MIERNWDRRPCGIRTHPHLLMTPPFVLIKPVAGKASKRPISVYTALSELRFVSNEDEDTFGPLASDTNPSPLSPVSQLQFASPEETMTPVTPIECTQPASPESPLLPSISSLSSPDAHEEQAWTTPSEQFPSTTCIASPPPQQPGWSIPRPDSPTISGLTKRRPLPEVPEHPQSRPLPPTPTEGTIVPCLQGSGRFSCPPRQEFIRSPFSDPLAPSRPVSDSGHDTRSQSVGEKRPKLYPTSEDTPPLLHPPALAIIPPPTVAIPTVIPPTLKPDHSAPILPHLLSPTSIDLITAAGLMITGENGQQISFGALFSDRKVIVILIRHFWCLPCQNYVRSISNIVTPEILRKKGVDLVLIGNGAPGMIKAYKSTPSIAFCLHS